MDRGIYISATAALAEARKLESTTNNLATINVPGAKKDLPVFEVYVEKPAETNSDAPGSALINTYVSNADIYIDFTQGPLKTTDNPHDMALSGEGFMLVKTEDGPRYTRNGSFTVDSQGRLSTRDGNVVQGTSGVIKLTSRDFVVDETGAVTEKGIAVGKIKVVLVDDPQSLMKLGSGLYAPKDGQISENIATDTKVLQNHLEMSNANAVKEMVAMINALRSYESNMKLIQSYDSITEKAISLGAR